MRVWIDRMRADERARARLVVAALVLVFLASAVRNIKEDGDFRGYLEVGELVLQHGDIYADADYRAHLIGVMARRAVQSTLH